MVAKIKAIIQTGITAILLCGVWQMIEYIIYGEVQPRIVDDIMVLFFITFIYLTCRYLNSIFTSDKNSKSYIR